MLNDKIEIYSSKNPHKQKLDLIRIGKEFQLMVEVFTMIMFLIGMEEVDSLGQ